MDNKLVMCRGAIFTFLQTASRRKRIAILIHDVVVQYWTVHRGLNNQIVCDRYVFGNQKLLFYQALWSSRWLRLQFLCDSQFIEPRLTLN